MVAPVNGGQGGIVAMVEIAPEIPADCATRMSSTFSQQSPAYFRAFGYFSVFSLVVGLEHALVGYQDFQEKRTVCLIFAEDFVLF